MKRLTHTNWTVVAAIVLLFGFSASAGQGEGLKTFAIPGCEDQGLSIHAENLEGTLTHLHGFDEVRHYFDRLSQTGVEICANTAVLDSNIYQYLLNFVTYRIKNPRSGVESRLAVLYQHSSIQGHHGTSLRPWIVISLSGFRSWLSSELSDFQSLESINSVGDVSSALKQKMSQRPAGALQYSVVPWTTMNGDLVFVAFWLERLTDPSSGLYSQYYAPKRQIFRYLPGQNRLEISTVSSAYGLMQALEAERLSLEARAPRDGAGKLQLLESLVETAP